MHGFGQCVTMPMLVHVFPPDILYCCRDPPSSPLQASVGEEAYVALDKGPITPTHALVVPIDHARCLAELTPGCFAEVERCVRTQCKTHLGALGGAVPGLPACLQWCSVQRLICAHDGVLS